jgi:TPR repeat protein
MNNPAFQQALEAFDRQDYETAREHLIPLANSSNAEAQCLLGNLYQLGLGVTPDAAIAIEWYAKASQQGCALATNNLAGMILAGNQDGSSNLTLAKQLYTEARRQGFEHAPTSLSFFKR